MNIVLQVWLGFEALLLGLFGAVEQGQSFTEIETMVGEKLSSIGRMCLAWALEKVEEQLRENAADRRGWVVVRREDRKKILTTLGEVEYKRTYYRNKKTGGYAYLADDVMGLTSHQRVSVGLKAHLVGHAADVSYRKFGEWAEGFTKAGVLSASTVMNSIRAFEPDEGEEKAPRQKRRCEVLFVEADEDHVAGQGGGNHNVPLVYVHEGKEKVNKDRFKLKGVRYFSGVYEEAEELWLGVWDYIEEQYDTSCLKKVFICGDGAQWVKKGLEVIPNSIFVLDLFHLNKYITAAFSRESEQYSQLWELIWGGGIGEIESWFKGLDLRWASESQREAVRACWRYISQNWYGITAYRLHSEAQLGVSAEAHVSHVLSARLSSRPMAWSKKGADQMARLRAMQANGESIRRAYIKQCAVKVQRLKASPPNVSREREQLRRVVGEVRFDNLPVLRGPVTQLSRALKAISRAVLDVL